ncbi:hypothetical protein NLG97_g141 [Lecanicillium saksenae]|uniref:Uncharacterized protein n=1 Tax=Lecanicillium saksenae TaxID=468837 RepID=A0ACC1R9B6_9HYPO|nr:hypothetical protein NLG97_g141 [Lecanicillium saksenae]
MHSKFFALAAAFVAAHSAAVPEPSSTISSGHGLPPGFVAAKGGALDLPPPRPTGKADLADAAAYWADIMTITYANRDIDDIHLVHRLGDKSPAALQPMDEDARIRVGDEQVVRYPGQFHGATFVNLARFIMTEQDETVVEMSFQNQNRGFPVGDVDVSYVNGFSRPVSCVCKENNITAGCSTYLWNYNTCPNDNWQGSCRNDKRWEKDATSPLEFFSPCHFHGGAFTYPRDDANTLNQRCPSEDYWCCIGASDECTRLNNNPR